MVDKRCWLGDMRANATEGEGEIRFYERDYQMKNSQL